MPTKRGLIAKLVLFLLIICALASLVSFSRVTFDKKSDSVWSILSLDVCGDSDIQTAKLCHAVNVLYPIFMFFLIINRLTETKAVMYRRIFAYSIERPPLS
jgi:hypothetical protein